MSLPTKENILEVLMDSNFYKKVGLYYSPEDFSTDVKKLVNDLHALLMSGNVGEPLKTLQEAYEKEGNGLGHMKVKETQWPSDKIVTGEYSYGAGYNQGRDDAIKAWQDAQGKQ